MDDLQHPTRFAAEAPDRPAVITPGGDVLTYGQLEARSCQVANALRAAGCETRRRTSRSCWRTAPRSSRSSGARCAPGSTSPPSTGTSSRDETRYIVEDCGASALVASAALGDLVDGIGDGLRTRIAVGGELPGFESYAEVARRAADEPAVRPVRGDVDVLLVGHHGTAEGREAAVDRGPARGAEPVRDAGAGALRRGRGHRLPEPGSAVPRRSGGVDHRGPPAGRHHGGHGPLRPAPGPRADRGPPGDPRAAGAHPPRAADEALRGGARPVRPVEPAGRRARRRALPARGEAGRPRVARPDRARVLLGQRGRRLLRHRPGGVARPPRLGRPLAHGHGAHRGRRRRRSPRGRGGHRLVRVAGPLRVPQRPGQDGRGHRRAGLGHLRRHRPARRRGLPLPDRPGVEHGHLRAA